jgi:hypothetical protein
MTDTVDRIRAKVARAKQHVEDFQLAVRDYVKSQPFQVGITEKPETGQRAYYVAKVDPVPLNVSGIASDVLGNLREAIDHVAYQLEAAGCGAPPKQKVYFPIANSAAEYPTLRKGNIKCAGQTAIDAIDATEPYKHGKGHGLWQLNALKKSDKHHLLIATSVISGGIDIAPSIRNSFQNAPEWARSSFAGIGPFFVREKTIEPLQVGDEIFLEPIDEEVDYNRQFLFEVSFHGPDVMDHEPAIKTLQELTNLVDGLVTAFVPLLP